MEFPNLPHIFTKYLRAFENFFSFPQRSMVYIIKQHDKTNTLSIPTIVMSNLWYSKPSKVL